MDSLRPGDVLITNDPWKTLGPPERRHHLPRRYSAAATAWRFFASTCHTADIGGHILSAEAREVYEEGLFIPIMKLYEAGEPNPALDRASSAPTCGSRSW